MPFERVERMHPQWPMFRLHGDGPPVWYTPGLAANGGVTSRHEIEARARHAEREWQEYVARPYSPECLTVYLSNQCNLACAYCYSAPLDPARDRSRRQPTIDVRAALAAARVVAQRCEANGKVFSLNFHGGGEPTQHWELLTSLRAQIGSIAAGHGLDVHAYIATNGVISGARLDWLAEHFSLIGLSADGPPDLQDAQRPSASGGATSAAVERTARRLNRRGAPFHLRVTVTRAAMHRQAEIVEYCVLRLHARTIRLEPSYQPRPGGVQSFAPEDAPSFVEHYMAARATARSLGAELHLSGVRLDEIHGAYCNPLRDVLQVTPDGRASACFLTADGDRADDEVLGMGRYDPIADVFLIDEARANVMRRQAARIPARCHDCVNVYHCARDCPDVCLITAGQSRRDEPGFRCRVQKLLSHELIKEWVAHGRTESL